MDCRGAARLAMTGCTDTIVKQRSLVKEFSAVIVRLDRTIQYSETSKFEPRGRRLLDAPLARGMTME
jgi:hypothetical protein